MMTLYSGTTDPYSHCCRIVFFEKGMDFFQIVDVNTDNLEDVAILNPYNQVPVLVERDLVLSEANIINEYVDERFPHPQLMPPDPIARARARLLLHRMAKDLFCHIADLESGDPRKMEVARVAMRDNLSQLAHVVSKQNYLMGSEYSMLDVAIAPLLWRLGHYGIELPKQATAILKYGERLFQRPLYADSMTPSEKAMRK